MSAARSSRSAATGPGRVEQYVGAIAAIARAERAGEPVMVHCIAGAQRTGGVIAVYEMLVERKPAAEAFAEMLRYGHDPSVNPKLTAYLDDHMGEIAAGAETVGGDRPGAGPAADVAARLNGNKKIYSG